METIELHILGNCIERNSGYEGGGIFCIDGSHIIANNLISENKAMLGGGIFIVRGQSQIISCTFVGNTAESYGGGIYFDFAAPVVMNTIIWGNKASTNAAIYANESSIKVAYSDVQGGWTGTGNLNVDPKIVADSLSNSSDCIGAGIHSHDFGGGIILSCPPQDINSRIRPFPAGSMPDIGAWESLLEKRIDTKVRNLTVTEIPQSFSLAQNYPNPFNPSTTIEFALPKPAFVKLKVYNLLGEEVTTLIAEQRSVGIHQFNWDAKGLASGVYLYRLEVCDPSTGSGQVFVQSKKLILIR